MYRQSSSRTPTKPHSRESNIREAHQKLTGAYDFTKSDAGRQFDHSERERVRVSKHDTRYDIRLGNRYAASSVYSQPSVYMPEHRHVASSAYSPVSWRWTEDSLPNPIVPKYESQAGYSPKWEPTTSSEVQRQASQYRKKEPYKQESRQVSFPEAPTDLNRCNTHVHPHKIEPREHSSARRTKTHRYLVREDSADRPPYVERMESRRPGYYS